MPPQMKEPAGHDEDLEMEHGPIDTPSRFVPPSLRLRQKPGPFTPRPSEMVCAGESTLGLLQ